jgi:hypothetical protein
VTWGIEQGELLCLSVKCGSSDFNSLALSLFLVRGIHDVSEPPGVTTLVFCLLLELFDDTAVNHAEVGHQSAADSGFSGVDVADKDQRAWLSGGVNLNDVVLVDGNFDVLDSFSLGLLPLFLDVAFTLVLFLAWLGWLPRDLLGLPLLLASLVAEGAILIVVDLVVLGTALCLGTLASGAWLGVSFLLLFLGILKVGGVAIEPFHDHEHVGWVRVRDVVQEDEVLLISRELRLALVVLLHEEERGGLSLGVTFSVFLLLLFSCSLLLLFLELLFGFLGGAKSAEIRELLLVLGSAHATWDELGGLELKATTTSERVARERVVCRSCITDCGGRLLGWLLHRLMLELVLHLIVEVHAAFWLHLVAPELWELLLLELTLHHWLMLRVAAIVLLLLLVHLVVLVHLLLHLGVLLLVGIAAERGEFVRVVLHVASLAEHVVEVVLRHLYQSFEIWLYFVS